MPPTPITTSSSTHTSFLMEKKSDSMVVFIYCIQSMTLSLKFTIKNSQSSKQLNI
uniref:Uncharacterized protein n=1 Tax=Arundo donax TaxID=35708 RepID=A0A0A8YND9_ARUDO